jgi:hypothetical protein
MKAFAVLLISTFTYAPAFADALVAKGTIATLTVEYEYVTSGKKEDKYDPYDWRVSRFAKLTAEMTAQAPQELSQTQPMDASQTADIKNKQALTQSAASKMSNLAADMEKIVARCGESEACIEREVAKYGSTMEITPELKSAQKDIAEVSKRGAPRFQAWRASSQKGTYSIDENYHSQNSDPLCESRPNKRCTRSETRKGGGDIPAPPGAKGNPSIASLEVDVVKNTLFIVLPAPMNVLSSTQIVTTDFSEEKSGTSQMSLRFPGEMKPLTVALAGDLQHQSGTQSIKMNGKGGEGGTLLVKWRFSIQ